MSVFSTLLEAEQKERYHREKIWNTYELTKKNLSFVSMADIQNFYAAEFTNSVATFV